MAKKKIRKVKLASLIVVGEGPIDAAFLSHMKIVYDGRETGQSIRITAGDGGCPKDVIKSAIQNRQAEYDKKYVLIDSDITVTDVDFSYARKNGVNIIQSTPVCLEGMLLEVLGERPARTNQGCKEKLHPKLSGLPTCKHSYAVLFTKKVLDKSDKVPIIELKLLMQNKTK
ncbi:conserved protein of unknown function [Shewanella benthica]|uniref:Uncharacterized protein n=1 Tax=Shewanella benthica TaxID=43661 RepID=A0A330M225_9GAMM|nr:hypothetical protein [Shewanella benthica]SQH76085.1 conserved protein of unknown function [Shewanella benthica]